MNKRSLGAAYERLAADFLKREGYRILEVNFRCRQGEIDVIARDGEYLVFVEVKFRKNSGSGFPETAVDGRKQRQICRTAAVYLLKNHIYDTCPCRFDVVAIEGQSIRLYKNAFEYCL